MLVHTRKYAFIISFLTRRGVVQSTVPLGALDVDQCPAPFYIPNAFKNTALCDYHSTFVCAAFICQSFNILYNYFNVKIYNVKMLNI